jgi:hypothetical protein
MEYLILIKSNFIEMLLCDYLKSKLIQVKKEIYKAFQIIIALTIKNKLIYYIYFLNKNFIWNLENKKNIEEKNHNWTLFWNFFLMIGNDKKKE